MQLAQLNITNKTLDVAEVQVITLGSAIDDDVYGAAFGFGSASVIASGHTPTTLATALAAQITSLAGSLVTIVASGATITLTSKRAGVPIDVSVFGPMATKEVTVPAAKKRDIILASVGFSNVPASGSTSEMVNPDNLLSSTKATLRSLEVAGLISVKPPLSSLGGVLSGGLDIADGETLTINGLRITGDVTVPATGTLTAVDCFFEGDVTVTAGGTCTLTGGRIMGTVTGTVAHDAGSVGI